MSTSGARQTRSECPPAVPAYVASVLRRLGYRVKLHRIPSATITREMRRGFQLSVDGDWFPDYPSPSSYIPQFFGCHGRTSNGYVCDRALERLMRRAERADGSNPTRAAALWRQVDGMIVNRAYWTELLHEPELVSRRVRNFQYSPVGDFIADQVWLDTAPGARN